MMGFLSSLLCFVLAIANVGIDLWQHDMNSLGGWASATFAWLIVTARDYKELDK